MAKIKEVVLVDAVRSPIGKSGVKGMKKNGQLCQASAQELLASTMRGLLDRVKEKAPNFDEREIEDVIVGCLSQIGEQGSNIGRFASLLAGIPNEVSACTVNQYCNAGLKAVNFATRALKVGDGDIILCSGVELMSHYGMGSDVYVAMQADYPVRMTSRIEEIQMNVPQGLCAEMISEADGHTREQLDRFGMLSMQKAVLAERNGLFSDHIIPFEYTWEGEKRVVVKDEVLRSKAVEDPEGFMQDIGGLKPPFKEGGMVTAGNSSQIVDGAAAVLLMTAEKAEKLGLEPLCKITGCASAGGDPVPMLLAPIPAVKKALKRAGKTMDDMDIIEPNEAFASPCLAFADEFGYDYDDPRVNPTGGAIALGHPIGASGIVYLGEMAHHLKRTKGRAGIQMMCGGGGIGIATVVEAV
ncbi:MAG: thiolase family protein [Desulfobacterales bacterium]|jgi:acetyl-CoA acyltransferase|nr:thiolase family protein [Desulfobacteraceae bacterium]MBT4363030.1 thiolase family protein [Desulfobacteraceae bacterium]MBT7084591.1 thiolase family protein [Desulfobacterales bacterium]MBT7697661.1 thiolase family protein [Desulfobacterales bacterium]